MISGELDNLLHRAEDAAGRAYAPYSRFFVGAAILVDSNEVESEVVTGCNVENASYRLTTCAEQTAIAAAVAKFGPSVRVRAVAVANLNKTACQPCGACRQTIAEFADLDCPILFPGEEGAVVRTVGELLPSAFQLSDAAR